MYFIELTKLTGKDTPPMIDVKLVERLIASQFPQWNNLPIWPVALSGWDNRTFHLGKEMIIRLPSGAEYALQVEKEQYWLPKLHPLLPLPIPMPLAMGKPEDGYPFKWSIYNFLEGEPAVSAHIDNLCEFAVTLAKFLTALQQINSEGGPLPGPHSFYRGGSLATYDAETRKAISHLKGKIDTAAATALWERALATSSQNPPVWVHGDISPGNLLVKNGKLTAVIDFGQLTIGDPACDLTIAWTFFKQESRKVFRDNLALDDDTWSRALGWALWKALIVAAGFTNPNNIEATQCLHIIDEVLK